MQKIFSDADLRAAIIQLEYKQAEEGKLLKEQFLLAYDSIKPINLINSTFREVAGSADLKNNLLNTVTGLTAGYLSKKIFERGKNNPVKKIIGVALMYGVTDFIAKNPETVKALGRGFLNIIRNKPGSRVH